MFDTRYRVSRVSVRGLVVPWRLGIDPAGGCRENRRYGAPRDRKHAGSQFPFRAGPRNIARMDNSRHMDVALSIAGTKEQTVGKPLQLKVQRRTNCGLRIFEPFAVSNLRAKQERMPAKIAQSRIFLRFRLTTEEPHSRPQRRCRRAWQSSSRLFTSLISLRFKLRMPQPPEPGRTPVALAVVSVRTGLSCGKFVAGKLS